VLHSPSLAFDLSNVIIEDIRMRNLGAVAARANVQYDAAHEVFDPLFQRLTGQVLPLLPEESFWPKLAAELHYSFPTKLRTTFISEFGYMHGMQSLLMTLRNLRVPTYVWTNMPTSWMDALHDQLSLKDLIAGYYNGHADGCYKPQPEFFRHALATHGLDRDSVIYVGAHRSNLSGAAEFTAEQWTFESAHTIRSKVQNLLRADRPPLPHDRSLAVT